MGKRAPEIVRTPFILKYDRISADFCSYIPTIINVPVNIIRNELLDAISREGNASIGVLYSMKIVLEVVENLVALGIGGFSDLIIYYKIRLRFVPITDFEALAKKVLSTMRSWEGDAVVKGSLELLKAAYLIIKKN